MHIFVFGSNLLGVHGAGAALHARRCYGACNGVGEGRTGAAYALPTKRTPYVRMPLAEIASHVDTFLEYARAHSRVAFQLTAVGCGRAGYTQQQIQPLFGVLPPNVAPPAEWTKS